MTSGRSISVLGPRRHQLSLHEHARPLLTAEEVRRLPDNEAIILTAGHPPIRARRAPYYADTEMAQRCRTPPPVRSDRIDDAVRGSQHTVASAGTSRDPLS